MKFSILFWTFSFIIINQLNFIQNSAVDYEEGKVLITKNVLNNYVVENQDVTVKYTAYNVGNQFVFIRLLCINYILLRFKMTIFQVINLIMYKVFQL